MSLIKKSPIWTPDNPDFNHFLDIPIPDRIPNLRQEFVSACNQYPVWGSRYIIGHYKKDPFKLASFQAAILDMLWNTSFPLLLGSRGMGKSFMLAIYALLKAVLSQNSALGEKIIIIGSAFRQSKLVFDEIVKWIKRSPLIWQCLKKGDIRYGVDECKITIGNSTIQALPLGTGEKIRGYRATIVIADEYAQIPEDIFDTVVRGFAAVSQDPIRRMEEIRRLNKLLKQGIINEYELEMMGKKNQIIISSTANYQFNHLYKTYQQYKNLIQHKIISKNAREHTQILGDHVQEGAIDYRNFSVCEIPVNELPEGFMDETQLSQARLTMSDDKYRMEFMCEFISDTKGFFRRSIIETCTPPLYSYNQDGEKTLNPNCFSVELKASDKAVYVMGIDPARSRDNFAISIVKIQKNKQKLVYMLTFNKKSFISIAPTVRELVNRFNIVAIGIDKGGGGQTLADILASADLVKDDKDRIFDKNDDQYEKLRGRHIIELINYQGEWLRNANYDLQGDFDHKRFLFPYVTNEEQYMDEDHAYEGSKIDEVGKVWQEIQDAKEEISAIVMTITGKSEIPHFDLPNAGENPSDTRRKDRYSAVLIASDQARKLIMGKTLTRDEKTIWGATGGWAEDFK